jgi:putative addiction module component (TIGR02574 family)
MIANLNTLPIDEKIQLVEDLWDSIAEEKSILPVTKEQKIELDSRLEAYELDGNKGREAKFVFADIKKRL